MDNNTYAYTLGENLYINLTNRCTNDCVFCVRRNRDGITQEHSLWLEKEPSVREVIQQMGEDLSQYEHIVFCGFGEPTIRLETLLEVAQYAKDKGATVRLDTNGLANLYFGRDIVPDLVGYIDIISISLNAPTAEAYEALCLPEFPNAYAGMLQFARRCVELLPTVLMSIVDTLPAEDIEKCRSIVEEDIGATLRIRAMIE